MLGLSVDSKQQQAQPMLIMLKAWQRTRAADACDARVEWPVTKPLQRTRAVDACDARAQWLDHNQRKKQAQLTLIMLEFARPLSAANHGQNWCS